MTVRAGRERRRGLALVAVVVLLAVVSTIMAVVTSQIMAKRRMLDRRHHELQAAWLARAGVERAADRILTRPGDWKDSSEILPQSQVKIAVKREAKNPDHFQVSCEASYPTDVAHPAVHTITRRCRRTVAGDHVRLEFLHDDSDAGKK